MSDKIKATVDVEKLAQVLQDLRYKASDAKYYQETYESLKKTHQQCPTSQDKEDLVYFRERCKALESQIAQTEAPSVLSKVAPHKIPAIKALRTKYPYVSILEAKQAVEALVGVANLIGINTSGETLTEIIKTAFDGDNN